MFLISIIRIHEFNVNHVFTNQVFQKTYLIYANYFLRVISENRAHVVVYPWLGGAENGERTGSGSVWSRNRH